MSDDADNRTPKRRRVSPRSAPISRRAFLGALGALGGATLAGPRSPRAMGENAAFDMPVIEYDSPTWNPRPTAVRRLLQEMEKRTSILITEDPGTVRLRADSLFGSPIVILAGDRGFDAWSSEARDTLGLYLSAGGTLVVDASEGRVDGEFDASVRREMARVLPEHQFAQIPSDHVLFKSFYLIEDAPGRVQVADFMEGIEYDGRLAVIYSHNDMMGAWARDNFGSWVYEVHPGGSRQREMAYRLGINIAMYALCLDYKEDQVHVPFIMRRRRWWVE